MTYIRTDKLKTEDGKTKYKFIHEKSCSICNENYEVRKGNKTPLKTNVYNYCSTKCRQEWYKKEYWVKLNCNNCNEEFEVSGHDNGRLFCSQKCNHIDMKNFPDKYNLREKAKRMHQSPNTNSPEAIQKMLNTNIERGHRIDWTKNSREDVSWDRFVKQVNSLTRNLRTTLLENWEGYDYYSNEYIKDNLTLPHYHGDYPTLDHKKPRSISYQEGMSIKETCLVDNLVWTTRRLNCSKGNKTEEQFKKYLNERER